jgi:predicted O-methyltransferase YrrM
MTESEKVAYIVATVRHSRTLEHISKRYGVELNSRSPIEIPDMDRIELAVLFSDLGYKVGAEIGVERGFYSLDLLRNNPGLRLYCVDYWTAYQGYREHVTQEKLDGLYADAAQRLEPYDAVLMRGKPSVERSKEFKDGSLDFVYIDANHVAEAVTEDLTVWTPKVKSGGIVSGHDYRVFEHKPFVQVVPAVNDFTRARGIDPWFITSGDRTPSFLWVVR